MKRLLCTGSRLLAALSVVTLGFVSSAHADWGVAEGSSVGYVSIKNDSIAENNRFTRVTGSINDDGQVMVSVDLASVETRVPVRNERMQAMLFEVATHPQALITAEIDPADLAQVDAGVPVERELTLNLSLHGSEATVTGRFRALAAGGQLYVTTLEPILVGAGDFGLNAGIDALQTVAGLASIARAIPVTVDLRLVRD